MAHVAHVTILVFARNIALCKIMRPIGDWPSDVFWSHVLIGHRSCFIPLQNSKCYVDLSLGCWVICRTARRRRASDIYAGWLMGGGADDAPSQHQIGSAEAAAPLLS